jgi:hypothetical protein
MRLAEILPVISNKIIASAVSGGLLKIASQDWCYK